MTQTIKVADGRRVTFDSLGKSSGFPIFLLHGTPGSRSGPRPLASVLYRLGVRLICYDRPGYGGSERHQGRMVGDAAWDVLAVADELGLPEFGVVGRSGGGPHALACAAQLDKSRLRCAVAMVSLAPTDAEHLNWFWGMADSNVTEYNLADSGADAVEADLAVRAKQIRDDPESLLRFLLPELTGPDRRIVSDVAIWRQLTDAYAEAFREGADGWIDDVLAFRRPWGFDLTKITVPVRFWHGADDVFSPISHTCWLAGQIPHAEVELQQGAAHFNAVEILPRVLAQMKKFHGSERLRIQSSH